MRSFLGFTPLQGASFVVPEACELW